MLIEVIMMQMKMMMMMMVYIHVSHPVGAEAVGCQLSWLPVYVCTTSYLDDEDGEGAGDDHEKIIFKIIIITNLKMIVILMIMMIMMNMAKVKQKQVSEGGGICCWFWLSRPS